MMIIMEMGAYNHLLTAACVFLIGGVIGLVLYPRFAVYAISAVALAYLLATNYQQNLPGIVWIAVLTGLTALADANMATLRTWYYRVSRDALWGGMLGGFFTMFIFGGSAFIFLVGTFVGALIGERSLTSVPTLFKNGLGVVVGLYGPICFKLFMGLAMIDSFLAPTGGFLGHWLGGVFPTGGGPLQ